MIENSRFGLNNVVFAACAGCVCGWGTRLALIKATASSLGKQHLVLSDVCCEQVNMLVVQRWTNTDQTCRWTLVNVKDFRAAPSRRL